MVGIRDDSPYPKYTAQYRLWVALQRAEPLIDALRENVEVAKQHVTKVEDDLAAAMAERDSLKSALEKLGPA